MKPNTIAVAAAALLLGALAGPIVIRAIIPNADAVPADKDERLLVASLSVTQFCATLLEDGGFSITTNGTIDRRVALQDGGFAVQTEALQPTAPCEVATLTRANIALCARAQRGLER